MHRLFVLALVACHASPSPSPTPTPTPTPAPVPAPAAHEHHHHDHSFQDADRWAAQFDAPDRDAWQQPAQVIEKAGIAAGDTVVDLGTGTGYFLPHLARAVGDTGKVIGLDSEPDMIAYVEKRIARDHLAHVEARVVPPDDPKLAPGSVTKILVVDTWHHLGQRTAYAKRLAAALACRPSGAAIVVVDFTADSPHGPPRDMRLPPETIVSELRAAGLTAEIATETLPHQYIVIGKKRCP
ncbi:MAG TPA: class I SAM-dependent methyltransferase [Kofleriaceae bacterium]|nr:class I SAM-dependent methyltransferase [Kofleriaceae bacterium]